MRVVMLTMGTRGDVQPFVALACGLRAAGHQPVLAAPAHFSALAAAHGIAFVPLPGDPAAFIRSMVDRAGTRFRWQTIREVLRWALPIAHEVMQQSIEAARGADVVLASFLTTTSGYQVARQMDVPFISAQLFPAFTPTGAFPMAALPDRGRLANRLGYHVAAALLWNVSRVAAWVLSGRCPDLSRRLENPFGPALRTLYAFSPQVLPPPPEWRDHTRVTGYWFLDEAADWTPAPALLDFLAAGEPPVCIGFGSMITREAQRLSALVVEAFSRSGRRAIVLGGWGEFGAAGQAEHLFWLPSAPHDWLFERVAAIVHHGGAGTTGAALRAGKPMLIVPFTGDQPFWGARMAALGVGPPPIAHDRLTAERLSAAVEMLLTDAPMRARAAELGRAIRDEDGVGRAIEAIEAFVHEYRGVGTG